MSERIRRVYTQDILQDQFTEIQPEYVYIRIPAEYVCIYHKLLTMFADFGVEMLDDCNSFCKDKNKNLINCFNMFNAAVAAHQLGNKKLADNLIKYIKGQINIQYNGKAPCPGMVYPVDKEGKIKAIVSCENYPKFYVNSEDGKLYEELMNEQQDRVYTIIDNDLTCNKNGE